VNGLPQTNELLHGEIHYQSDRATVMNLTWCLICRNVTQMEMKSDHTLYVAVTLTAFNSITFVLPILPPNSALVHLGITIGQKIARQIWLGGRLEYLGELDCLFFFLPPSLIHHFHLYREDSWPPKEGPIKLYPILYLVYPNLILSLTDQIPLIDPMGP